MIAVSDVDTHSTRKHQANLAGRGGEAQMLHLARGLKGRGHQQWIVGQPTSPIIKNAGAEGLEAFALNMSSEFSAGAVWKLSSSGHYICVLSCPYTGWFGGKNS